MTLLNFVSIREAGCWLWGKDGCDLLFNLINKVFFLLHNPMGRKQTNPNKERGPINSPSHLFETEIRKRLGTD